MIVAERRPVPRGAKIVTASTSYGTPTVTSATLFTPAGANTDAYNHSPKLFRLPGSNRIYLWWNCCGKNEDSAGARIVGQYSDDDGATWSARTTILAALAVEDLTGEVDCDVQVVGPLVTNGTRSFIIGEVHSIVWTASVQTTRTLKGVFAVEFTGGTLGSPAWLYGSGLSWSSWSGADKSLILGLISKPGFTMAGFNVYGQPTISGNAPDDLIESFAYQTPSDGWIRLGRGYTYLTGVALSSFLYTQWSPDGMIWTQAEATAIANAPALVGGYKLANNKICVLWNPDVDRNKLTMTVSTDGISFANSYTIRSGLGTTPTYSGAYKGGGPQYPSAIERSDGKLLVAYSVFKELMAVSVVTVP